MSVGLDRRGRGVPHDPGAVCSRDAGSAAEAGVRGDLVLQEDDVDGPGSGERVSTASARNARWRRGDDDRVLAVGRPPDHGAAGRNTLAGGWTPRTSTPRAGEVVQDPGPGVAGADRADQPCRRTRAPRRRRPGWRLCRPPTPRGCGEHGRPGAGSAATRSVSRGCTLPTTTNAGAHGASPRRSTSRGGTTTESGRPPSTASSRAAIRLRGPSRSRRCAIAETGGSAPRTTARSSKDISSMSRRRPCRRSVGERAEGHEPVGGEHGGRRGARRSSIRSTAVSPLSGAEVALLARERRRAGSPSSARWRRKAAAARPRSTPTRARRRKPIRRCPRCHQVRAPS